jgi:hypothetical protein
MGFFVPSGNEKNQMNKDKNLDSRLHGKDEPPSVRAKKHTPYLVDP